MQEGDADVVSAKWNEQNSTNVSMNLDMVRSNHCLMLPIANVKTVISYRYLYEHLRFNMFLMSVLKLETV